MAKVIAGKGFQPASPDQPSGERSADHLPVTPRVTETAPPPSTETSTVTQTVTKPPRRVPFQAFQPRPSVGDVHASGELVSPASAADAAACLAIYRPYVEHTAISWEIEVPTVDEMAARIAAAQANHEWLVLERDRRVIGFAYGHSFNRFATYRWSTEIGLYVDAGQRRTGAGRVLYAELLRRLAERGYRQAFAGITQPNEASNGFHRSFGFTDAGLYRRVQWKHDSWHDVAWMQLDLLADADPEEPPGPIGGSNGMREARA